MSYFLNENSAKVILDVSKAIVENRAYLSEIDGKIGDGDHGVNMAKGFGRAAERIEEQTQSFSKSLQILSDVLMNEIGGSMGPLYGMMFADMADVVSSSEKITAKDFSRMLDAGLEGVQAIGEAQVGDKCLLDTLVPACATFKSEIQNGSDFNAALNAMAKAADEGRDSTIDLVAKIGRASRLGERSRGVLDAGATSCAIILNTMANTIGVQLTV